MHFGSIEWLRFGGAFGLFFAVFCACGRDRWMQQDGGTFARDCVKYSLLRGSSSSFSQPVRTKQIHVRRARSVPSVEASDGLRFYPMKSLCAPVCMTKAICERLARSSVFEIAWHGMCTTTAATRQQQE